ncbi:hypothetical protein [Raineya sp.]
MRTFLLSLLTFCFTSITTFAQTDWQELKMGSSPKKWQGKLTDISNPNSLDEKIFLLNEEIDFYGLKSLKVELSFYNNRLFSIKLFFSAQDWEKLKDILTKNIDAQGEIDDNRKEGYWYKGNHKNQFAVFTLNNEMTLSYTDYEQKDFHWKDLFQGTVLYVLLTIVGLFFVWFGVAWLWTSYCPKCRSFTMEHVKRDTRTRAVNTGTFVEQMLGSGNVEMRFKYVDYYRCKKCGYETKYKYKS